MMEFMERFDPIQIRYGGNEIRRLIELTAVRADQLRQVCQDPGSTGGFMLMICSRLLQFRPFEQPFFG